MCARARENKGTAAAAAAGQSGKGALDQKKNSSFLLGAEERQGCVGGALCVGGAQRQPITTVPTTKTSVCRPSLRTEGYFLPLPAMSHAANVGVDVCGFSLNDERKKKNTEYLQVSFV